jgi:hypothetical protein
MRGVRRWLGSFTFIRQILFFAEETEGFEDAGGDAVEAGLLRHFEIEQTGPFGYECPTFIDNEPNGSLRLSIDIGAANKIRQIL